MKITPELRASVLSFRAGLVALAVIAVALAFTLKARTGMPFAPTTKVEAYFGNIHSLKVNDLVREDSKRVGRVSAISYQNGHALVTMELDGKVGVYSDAKAEVWDLSALATKFVELQPGTPSAGALDAPIGTDHTQDSADLYQVLDVLDPKTRAAATSAVRELGTGVTGHAQDLSSFLQAGPDDMADLTDLSKALADPNTNLTGLIQSANQLASRFKGQQQQIADLVSRAGTTLQATGVDNGQPLAQTIQELPGALSHLNTATARLQAPLADTAAAMRSLAPGAAALGQSTPDLRAFLRNAVPVAAKVAPVAHDALPAVSDLTTTFSDARPLAPRVENAVGDLESPLQVLSRYTTDLWELWMRGASFVSEGPNPGVRYARLGLTPGVNTITGGVLKTNVPQDNYPAPGQAQNDRAKGLLPPGLD